MPGNKKLMITGGAGFIGHHVIEYLLDNTDYDIVSLDKIDFAGNLNRISDIALDRSDKVRLKIVYHDLRAPINQQIQDVLGDVNIILHLAASSHVTRSIIHPIEFVENNVNGTVNLLEYARSLSHLEKMIYFSTDEVFGPAIQGAIFREHDRYNAANPYSASKAAAEEMCVAYHNTYNIPIAITHTMNVYGERQNPEKYIPMVIKKLLNAEPIIIHYNSATNDIGSRCYLHAKDVANALLFILNLSNDIPYPENSLHGKIRKFNIASEQHWSNLAIAKMIQSSLDPAKELNYQLVDPKRDRPGHDFTYSISGNYLKSLGWRPTQPIDERLPNLVRWYASNKHWLR